MFFLFMFRDLIVMEMGIEVLMDLGYLKVFNVSNGVLKFIDWLVNGDLEFVVVYIKVLGVLQFFIIFEEM